MGVGGCGWPSSANVSLMVRPYFKFTNSAPNSASAAGDATNFNMVRRVKIAPLSVMGSPSLRTTEEEISRCTTLYIHHRNLGCV